MRELREEIGLIVQKIPERLFKIDACTETDQEFVWVYRYEAEGPFQLDSREIECGEWVAPEDVTRRVATHPQDFAGAFRLIWKKYSVAEKG